MNENQYIEHTNAVLSVRVWIVGSDSVSENGSTPCCDRGCRALRMQDVLWRCESAAEMHHLAAWRHNNLIISILNILIFNVSHRMQPAETTKRQAMGAPDMGWGGKAPSPKMLLSPHRKTWSRMRRYFYVRNFQTLIVSAVKICKQCLQTASASPIRSLDPTGGLSTPAHPCTIYPNENSWRPHRHKLSAQWNYGDARVFAAPAKQISSAITIFLQDFGHRGVN